jgi:predicted transcriptional regulator
MTNRIQISVGDGQDGARRFTEVWRAAEAGDIPDEPCVYLVFEDLETLLRSLTPTRWTLLKALRRAGPSSVRSLSRSLGRDYKNVHGDVRLLERLGLITRSDDGKPMVPWDKIATELSLAA